MPAPDTELNEQLAEAEREIARLRRIVGPCEKTYLDVCQDLLAARDAARGAQARVGVINGHMAELRLQLQRAQQDRPPLQRVGSRVLGAVLSRAKAVLRRFAQ